MLVDGRLQPLADARYLLSPGDLYTLEQVPEIVRAGVSALKIEGRYKDPDYVALTTSAYRKAVDEACAGIEAPVSPLEKLRLEQVYSRGLGPYFVTGTDHQAVVNGRAPRHRGVCMGRVESLLPDGILVHPAPANALAPLKPGDGIVFDAADWRSPEEPEEGGRVYAVSVRRDGKIELRFANNALNWKRIRPGDLVWRSHDPDLDKLARAFTEPAGPLRRQPVKVRAVAREGQPLATVWSLQHHPEITVEVASPAPLAPAQNRGLNVDLLRDQFGRLGGTAYELAGVELDLQGTPFAPSSLLNQLRREAVERLQALQAELRPPAVLDPSEDPGEVVSQALRDISPRAVEPPAPQIHLLVRTPAQLEAALECRPASITLDYLDLYGLRPSVERVKSVGILARVAGPRIFKPGEERILDFLLSLDCPILVRAAGLLDSLQHRPHSPLVGDFSLNAANALSADTFLRLGLDRLTPTHDLNAEQVAALARQVGPHAIEAVMFQHLPVFHTEHCVFARFLSTGSSYRDCGRPCERHSVELRDPSGRAHPVMADVGCRNTVFGAEAQQACAHLESWQRAGIRHFRLEFVHESADQLTRIARAFAEALAGRTTFRQLERDLDRSAPQGVTEGSLFVSPGYLELPVLQ
jgi:putative protease